MSGFIGREPRAPEDDPSEPVRCNPCWMPDWQRRAIQEQARREREAWIRNGGNDDDEG